MIQIEDIDEETTTQLRRSTKERKPNPRYVNATLAKKDKVKELIYLQRSI